MTMMKLMLSDVEDAVVENVDVEDADVENIDVEDADRISISIISGILRFSIV